MNQPKMIENEKDLDCQGKHKLPISMVVLDPKLRSNQRLLCQQCIDDYETDAKTIGFKKVIQMLEDNRKKLLETLEVIIKQNIQNVELFQTQVYNLKSNLIQQLDHMIGNTKDWISNLQSAGSKYREYSFYEELDSIVMNQSSAYKDQINLSNQINMLYDTWNTKINSKLEIFKSFQEYKKCKDILNNLTQQSQRVEQISSNPTIKQNIPQDKKQYNLVTNNLVVQQYLSPSKLEFIYNSIKQHDIWKIMVSTGRNAIIKIWNFDNGMIKQTHSLLGHQVICLVHSQINNYFVSGSSDGSIIMWKYYDNNEWKSSKLQNKHKKYIYCIILTENENQLISCSDDSSIKVWTVNFNNHESNFLYSLDKHAGSVYSLSLNQSEKVLVSCGSDQIIIWKKEINTQWKFQYVVNQSIQEYGFHVKFLKEDQFIWAPYKSNNLCVFECKDDGLYQENIEKRVQFKKDNKGLVGLSGFPIIYNKLKNMICLRHVCHICLLKFENDGQLSIVEELDCLNWEIYGTVTNNGQYLVFWGKKKDTYQAYEILYK